MQACFCEIPQRLNFDMINEQFRVKEFHKGRKKKMLFDELRIAIILLWKEGWQL